MSTKAQIATEISAKILTGGSRTTAFNTRSLLNDMNNSYVNITDAGLVIQAELGYSAVITPTSNYSFATKKYVDDVALGTSLATVLAIGNNTGPTSIIFDQGVPSTVPVFDASNHLVSSSISTTVFNYISGLTGNVETRLTNLETGLTWKGIVKVIATTNQVISGTYTLDGYPLQIGDRVLLAGQTLGKNNGIYVVASGPWTRATDFDGTADNIKGAVTPCEQGTYADKAYVCTNTGAIVIGTTPLTFTLFGGTIYTGAGGRISVSGSTIDIDASYVGQSSITTLGTITTGTLGSGAKILVGSDATGDIWYNGGSGAIARSANINFGGNALNVSSNAAGANIGMFATSVATNSAAMFQATSDAGLMQMFKVGSTVPAYKNISASDAGIYSTTGNMSFLNEIGNINWAAGGASSSQMTLNTNGSLSMQCIVGASSTPTIVAGTGAGTAPTVTITGTNISGTITVTAGTAPTVGGIVCTVTLSGSFAYANELCAVISPASSDSVLASAVFCVDTSTSAFKIQEGSGLGLVAGKVYVWKYQVTGR